MTHLTRRTDMRSAKRLLESHIDKVDHDRVTLLMDRPRRARPDRPAPSGQQR